MAFLGILLVLAGPLIVLGIWLWLRSRREPVALVEPLDIGRVLGRAFEAFSILGWPMLLLAILFVGASRLVQSYISHTFFLPQMKSGAISPLVWGGYFYGLNFLAGLVSGLFQVPAVIMLVGRHEGRPISIGAAWGALPFVFLPVVAVGVLELLGFVAGLLLFVLPGFLLVLSWMVAPIIMTVERPGILAALRRSRDLSIGSRGRILLVLVLVVLIVVFASAPQFVVARLMPDSYWPMAIYGALVSTAANILSVGMNSALYVELRRIREGLSAPGLAEVFA